LAEPSKDRRLGTRHLDEHVVDATASQCAEHMLDRLDFRVALLDRWWAHQIGDMLDPRTNFRSAAEVDALKT